MSEWRGGRAKRGARDAAGSPLSFPEGTAHALGEGARLLVGHVSVTLHRHCLLSVLTTTLISDAIQKNKREKSPAQDHRTGDCWRWDSNLS